MSEEKKLRVFPTRDEIEEANRNGTEIARQLAEQEGIKKVDVSLNEQIAAEEMARVTAEQMANRDKIYEQQKQRMQELNDAKTKEFNISKPNYATPASKTTENVNLPTQSIELNKEIRDILELSKPQMDEPFDVITLPSNGLLYRNKKRSVKVSYLTASDENILTNPNLINSGRFLEIILNRKILEYDLRYHDLHVGDRNAIMLWLRSTAYGHEYPITLIDPDTFDEFESIIDLSTIPIKSLSVETDNEGLIDFILPVSKKTIKFKFLTVSDVDDIEDYVDRISINDGPEFVDKITYTLEKQIIEIDGERDRDFIKNFIKTMRAGDSKAFRKYINEIESGVDMKLNVTTPSGKVLNIFLPFNLNFFWPES